MPIRFIGLIRGNNVSEIDGPSASFDDGIDPDFVRDFARAHEDGGFERVLIGYHTTGPDGWAVAAHGAASTSKLHMLIAHRPGFVAPPLAARKAATLDQITGGRISLNIVTGGSDEDQTRDGDWSTKNDRYRRTEEFLDIVRRVWTSDTPFDYDGDFYRVRNAFSTIKPLQKPSIPIYFGGASDAAVPVAAKHADVYMLWGEPVQAVRERIAAVRAVTPPGRDPEFSVSFRPILGRTDEEAWDTARDYLDRIVSQRSGGFLPGTSSRPGAMGSQRLLDFAAQQEVFDKCLWMSIAAATGAGGNTTALVGTPEKVADAILDYYDAGVSNILIRGFKPYEDTVTYGRELLPLVKAKVARRDRALTTAHAAD